MICPNFYPIFIEVEFFSSERPSLQVQNLKNKNIKMKNRTISTINNTIASNFFFLLENDCMENNFSQKG